MNQNTTRHDPHAKSRDEDAPTWGPASQNTGKATGHASPSASPRDGAVSPASRTMTSSS